MKKSLTALATCAVMMAPTTAHAQTFDFPVPAIGYTSSMMAIVGSSQIFGLGIGCTTIPDPNGEPGSPLTQWIRCYR